MAKSKILGLDIGGSHLKMALCENGSVIRLAEAAMPENMVKNGEITMWDALAVFVKEQIREAGINARYVSIALPVSDSYLVRTKMPKMPVKQLMLNIPYEFHEFLTEDADQYSFDYAVLGERDNELDLVLAAVRKDLIPKYETMCRRAGLRLRAVIPEELCLRRILLQHEERSGCSHGEQDYAVLDLGEDANKMHFFTKGEFDVTRTMEPGCRQITEAISNASGESMHTAMLNQDFQTERNEAVQNDPQIEDIYSNIAMQIMRVLNFYSFNNPSNNLDRVYYCGGGSKIRGLMDALRENIDLPLVDIGELINTTEENKEACTVMPIAVGSTTLNV